MTRTLVNLSGGIDSTYSLWRLLSDGERCLVHHIVLRNHERRDEAESRAVANVLAWLTQQRLTNWTYIESTFDYGTLGHIVRDVNVWGFLTGVILANPKNVDVTRVAVCRNADDFATPAAGEPNTRRRVELTRIVSGREPEWVFPVIGMTKAAIIEAMPPELFTRSWWCRRPSRGLECGRCVPCLKVRDALRAGAAVPR